MLEGRAAQVTAAAIEIPRGRRPRGTRPDPTPRSTSPGLTPVVVPNADFYRIDTALITPAVDLAGWNLAVFGMVDHEVTLTFDDLCSCR